MQAQPAAPITPGREPYDAIVVGSGAAGGMAAFQLAVSGIKVLLLEAGRMLDPQKEYKTMEWPYKDMRRHRLPVGEFALSAAEYRTLDRPFGLTPEMEKFKKVMAYSGNHFTREWIVNEKEHPITGTPYAWVRARVLGGKTNLWGRVSLRFSEIDLKAKTHDGFGDDWPIGYADIAPYYDKVDTLLGHLGHEGKHSAPARRHLPAPAQTELRRGAGAARHREDGPQVDPGPRRRHDRRCPRTTGTGPAAWAAVAVDAGATSTPRSIRQPR